MSTARYVHCPICPQPDVFTARYVHGQTCPVPDMSTARCFHSRYVHSPMFSQPDMPTARYAHSPICAQPNLSTARCFHSPICPQPDMFIARYNNNIIIIAFKGAIRDFLQSPHSRELSPTRTLKWPGRNRVQITCNTSSAYHVQVSCYVPFATKG